MESEAIMQLLCV